MKTKTSNLPALASQFVIICLASLVYSYSFAFPKNPPSALQNPLQIAAAISWSAVIAWAFFAGLLALKQHFKTIYITQIAALLFDTMLIGSVWLIVAACFNFLAPSLSTRGFLTTHLLLLLCSNISMAITFLLKARILGIKPPEAILRWCFCLNLPFLISLQTFALYQGWNL